MNKLIVANWKMNGDLAKINQDLSIYSQNSITNSPDVVLSLPNVFLSTAQSIIKNNNSQFKLSAQDVSQFSAFGAYTGEVNASMLNEVGVEYVIIGHSERRMYLGESGSVLLNKLENSLNSGLKPIFCIGEQLEIRQNNTYLQFLSEQLELLLQIKAPFNELVIAYEPIWSIGTGIVPKMEDITEVINLISAFVQTYLPHVKITALYGGSVSDKNAHDILNLNGVGGVLVGGASLNTDNFTTICSI